VTPCIVDIAVSKSIPRFDAGSYDALAMSTRSSRPRPASFARRKFTSRTHSGQSPSYRTRTSHVAADASHGGICREGVVVDVDVDVDDDDDDARARSALGGGGARTRGREEDAAASGAAAMRDAIARDLAQRRRAVMARGVRDVDVCATSASCLVSCALVQSPHERTIIRMCTYVYEQLVIVRVGLRVRAR
jgi:hypothetical protein